jgi:hypothetical protein
VPAKPTRVALPQRPVNTQIAMYRIASTMGLNPDAIVLSRFSGTTAPLMN